MRSYHYRRLVKRSEAVLRYEREADQVGIPQAMRRLALTVGTQL